MHTFSEGRTLHMAVLTISDSRTKDTDKSGQTIQSLLQEDDFQLADYEIVKDEIQAIQTQVKTWCEDDKIDGIILTGGTGFSPRDVTHEAVSSLLDKEMDGFGELFRMLSYEEIGPQTIFSRALAGSRNTTAIYALPGSTNAIKLGMNKIIIPTVPHFVKELHKQ